MNDSVRLSNEASLLRLNVALALPDGLLAQILGQVMMLAIESARVPATAVLPRGLVVQLVVLDQHGLVLEGLSCRSLMPAVAMDHACGRTRHSDEFLVAHVRDVAVNVIGFEQAIVVFGSEQLVLVVQLLFLAVR